MRNSRFAVLAAAGLVLAGCAAGPRDRLKEDFLAPPDAARPGVYWYFMDGNLSREGRGWKRECL